MKRALAVVFMVSACAGHLPGDDLPGVEEGDDPILFAGQLVDGQLATVCNASDGLRQRSGPGTSYATLRVMPEGTLVTILAGADGWYRNDWDGDRGWSSGKYLCPVEDGAGGGCGISLPTDGAWSCDALTGTTTNPDDVYYTTSYGCWVDSSGVAHSDGDDNCIPACPLSKIGCSGLSGPACERQINWYIADSDRFGCGTRVKVTNTDNGKSAVLMSIDRGPNCTIERRVDFWVLDMSYRASYYLFGGPTSATERADVKLEVVDAATPLGPWTGPPAGECL